MPTGAVGSGNSERLAKVPSWTFSIQYPFAEALILRTPAQHFCYLLVAAHMSADISDGLVGPAQNQGMWVRAITRMIISARLGLLNSRQ